MVEPYYVGVDVGTASVRAALVSRNGKIVSSAIRPLKIWKSQPNYFEQSSEDIWRNVCTVVKVVVTQFYDLGPPGEGGGELSAGHGGVLHPSQNPSFNIAFQFYFSLYFWGYCHLPPAKREQIFRKNNIPVKPSSAPNFTYL